MAKRSNYGPITPAHLKTRGQGTCRHCGRCLFHGWLPDAEGVARRTCDKSWPAQDDYTCYAFAPKTV